MKKFKKHTPKQIVVKLERATKLKGEGKTNVEVARDLQISEATLVRWSKSYGQMDRAQARELKQLRDENDKLKRLLGQSELEKAALKELAGGKLLTPTRRYDAVRHLITHFGCSQRTACAIVGVFRSSFTRAMSRTARMKLHDKYSQLRMWLNQ